MGIVRFALRWPYTFYVLALLILFLGGMAWIGAHDLDPPKSLESSTAPLEIEVVSLDWRWLFI